jgi:predicted AAA+ superfamily ATPase
MTTPLFTRRIRSIVVEGLRDARIVLISGARQVGKTTLSTEIAATDHPMRTLTLDDDPTREAALGDPAGFIAGLHAPVLIDEIQRAPGLLLEIKKVVDRDTTPGRFLLTGSANVLSSKRIIDALTGRIDRIRMWPLARSEILGGELNIVDELLAGRAPQLDGAPVGHQAFSSVIAEGGYPEARLRPAGRSRERWFESYIDTALERDLREITDARRIDEMGRLLRLLASQSANLLSYRAVGQRLEMHHDTVQAYVTLLEQMFLIQRLPAWRPGLGARESSRPKVYVCDPGMLAYLLGADVQRIERDDQVTGKACETLVAAELLKHASWAQHSIRAYHYQREREDIDFILESRAGDLAAIEVKAKATLHSADWKWLAALRDARGDRFKSGIVIYSGEQTIPLGDRLWAIPYAGLWT